MCLKSDDRLNLRLDFLSSFPIRNSNAEDRVRRPQPPLSNIRALAHIPPSSDPSGKCVGANDKVLDGVKAEGKTLARSYLNPN